MARAAAAHWADGVQIWGDRVPGTSFPHSAPHSLMLGGIVRVAHTDCPGSQGPAGGCLKSTT